MAKKPIIGKKKTLSLDNYKRKILKCLSLLWALFLFSTEGWGGEAKKLHIYTWHGIVTPEMAKEFFNETGIEVSLDFYDSNEMLEAKLLLGNSGYDLVFPSAWPYLARQIPAKLYRKIDPNKIPNLKKIEKIAMQRLQEVDAENAFAIPLIWGIVGFGIDEEALRSFMPEAPVDSWAMFFDPKVIKRFQACGVTLLEEAIDVMLPAFLYMGVDPKKATKKDLQDATDLIRQVRPFISRFDASRSHNELVSGNMCLVQHWISNLYMAHQSLPPEQRRSIKVIIPKEGAGMWIDVMAIPSDAPHPENAHLFIDFILRPENVAKISNYNFSGNFVSASKPFLDAELIKNPHVFPDVSVFDKLHLTTPKSPSYQRLMTRAMTKIRTGK